MSRVLHDKPALLSENMASCQKPSIAEEANEDMKPRLDDDVWSGTRLGKALGEEAVILRPQILAHAELAS